MLGGQANMPHPVTILAGSPEEGVSAARALLPESGQSYSLPRWQLTSHGPLPGKGVRCSPNPVRQCPVRNRLQKSG